MKVIDASKNRILQLGMQGEHDRTQVVFDCSDVIAEFPGGSVSLRVVTPGQTEPHPVMIDDAGEGKFVWMVSDSELAVKGIGECQLVYTFGDGKAKTRIWETSVLRALVGDAEPPSPWVDYVEAVEAAAQTAETAADRAEEAAEKAEESLYPLVDIRKVKDFLYESWYDRMDYTRACEYFKAQEDPVSVGACTAVRKGQEIGRNFDWTYDNETEFVVHVEKIGSRHASVGVAGGFKTLTGDEFIGTEEFDRLVGIIPFQMRDGINDSGLFAEVNVVPADKGKNRAIPLVDSEVELSAMMVIRYVLDHFETAKEAAEYLRDHATIYFPKALHDMEYELHYLIADGTNTYVVEFEEGHTVIEQINDKPYMTNFHLSGVEYNTDGKVYTPDTQDADHDAIRTNHVTEHGSGLERYNLIVEHHGDLDLREILDELTYTRMYPTSEDPANPAWYTEFVGGSLKCNSPVSEFSGAMQEAGQAYLERSRDTGLTWQTVHSSVYDLRTKGFKVITQEDGQEVSFALGVGDVTAESVLYDPQETYSDGTVGKEVKLNAGHRQATGNPHGTTFEQIVGKPDAYPPEYHTHSFESITNKPDAYPPEYHSHTFESITDKPDAYPPEDHEHLASEITYDAGTVDDAISALNRDKVDKQQAVADAGKVLGIGADGKVVPVDGGGGAEYTAGYGISISAENVISVSLPDAEEGEF